MTHVASVSASTSTTGSKKMYAVACPPPVSSVKHPGTTRVAPTRSASAAAIHLCGLFGGNPPAYRAPPASFVAARNASASLFAAATPPTPPNRRSARSSIRRDASSCAFVSIVVDDRMASATDSGTSSRRRGDDFVNPRRDAPSFDLTYATCRTPATSLSARRNSSNRSVTPTTSMERNIASNRWKSDGVVVAHSTSFSLAPTREGADSPARHTTSYPG